MSLSLIKFQNRRESLPGGRLVEKFRLQKKEGISSLLEAQKLKNVSWTASKFAGENMKDYSNKIEFLNKAYSQSFSRKESILEVPCRVDQVEKANALLEEAAKKVAFLPEDEWFKFDILGQVRMFRVSCEDRGFPAFFQIKQFTANPKEERPLCDLKIMVHRNKNMCVEKTDFDFFSAPFSVKYQKRSDESMKSFFIAIKSEKNVTLQMMVQFEKKLKASRKTHFGSTSQPSFAFRPFSEPSRWPDTTSQDLLLKGNSSIAIQNHQNLHFRPKEEEESALFPTQVLNYQESKTFLEEYLDNEPVSKPQNFFVQMNSVNIKEYVQEKRLRLSTSMQRLEERTKDAQTKKRERIKMKREASISFIQRPEVIRKEVMPFCYYCPCILK